jgi:hypothetical protein
MVDFCAQLAAALQELEECGAAPVTTFFCHHHLWGFLWYFQILPDGKVARLINTALYEFMQQDEKVNKIRNCFLRWEEMVL